MNSKIDEAFKIMWSKSIINHLDYLSKDKETKMAEMAEILRLQGFKVK